MIEQKEIERRQKISLALKGKKKPLFTDKHRKNLGKARKGKINGPLSLEHKEKISRANKLSLLGNTPWNKGKKGSQAAWNKGIKGYLAKEKHYNWQNGITLLSDQIRTSFEYRQWRSDVFTRDKFKCVKCNKGNNIHAHHIKAFSKLLKEYNIKSLEEAISCQELWNINNGSTLCVDCHKTKHKNYVR